ncbi:MAG: flagellar hook-length control protein FliK [Clostridia bacterium]|nr:flagellar hook-length control protein FliK [Clostridia bacterium]
MNSRELGLVSSAYNSLLGTVGAQSAQQMDSTKSFSSVLDNKLQYAEKNKVSKSYSSEQQVNREALSAKDSEYENDRDAYVKSDMQQSTKKIANTEKKQTEPVEKENDIKRTQSTEEVEENVEAIESIEENVVEEMDPEQKEVMDALMALLMNDTLTDEEKVASINELLGNLTQDQLDALSGMSGVLKKMLMSFDGTLDQFEETLSSLTLTNSEFSNLLEQLQQTDISGMDSLEMKGSNMSDVSKEAVVMVETDLTVESTMTEEVDETVEKTILDKVAETVEKPEVAKESAKETKAEVLKEAAESNTEKLPTVTETSSTSTANGQSNQNQTNAESNQAFSEMLKFHNASVKSVAMKSTMASNPFEEKIMQQIIRGTSVSLNVGKDVSEIMIKLNPKELGNVSLKMSLENDQLVAKFSVENQTVKEVLESRLEDLRTALADKGFTIQGLDVSVNQDTEEQFKTYEEFIKQQKGKRRLDEESEDAAIEGIQSTASTWQTLETTSSEINVLA